MERGSAPRGRPGHQRSGRVFLGRLLQRSALMWTILATVTFSAPVSQLSLASKGIIIHCRLSRLLTVRNRTARERHILLSPVI
jgi:hypothetical protein